MRREHYAIGTQVQRTTGYVFLKTDQGMVALHRWVAAQKILGRDLKEGEVVIRKKPNRLDNRPENLVVVQHSLVKFVKLPHSRIIYVPRKAPKQHLLAA